MQLLLSHLEGKLLSEIRERLRNRRCILERVLLSDLCEAVLYQLTREGIICNPLHHHLHYEIQVNKYTKMICILFDLVDIDSRGILHFDDFTSFCLRIARNMLSPVAPKNSLEFRQEIHTSTSLPAQKLYFAQYTQTLYALSNDSPLIHEYGPGNKFQGVCNPLNELRKLIAVHGNVVPNLYHERKLADRRDEGIEVYIPRADKVTVICMEYIRTRRMMVLSSSNCYLSFFDSELRKIKGYIHAKSPQVGIKFLNSIGMLLTWSGTEDNYCCSIWDVSKMLLKYQILQHTCHILDICEVTAHELVASSDINQNVLLWSCSHMNLKSGKRKEAIRLRGHSMMIRVLAYAAQQDVLLGCGLDFDAYAWDPFTGLLVMHLNGHQHCLLRICVIYDPFERAVTCDEAGNIKVWNINRDVGRTAEVLQSIEINLRIPFKLCDVVATYEDGKYIAILADRIYSFNNLSITFSSGCPVHNGLVICSLLDTFFVIFPREICIVSLHTGAIQHTLRLGIDGSDRDCLGPTDFITTAAISADGKKLFTGSNLGYCWVFDTASLGALKCLHAPDSTTFESAITNLTYLDNDESLILVFASGAIREICGCYRLASDDVDAQGSLSPYPSLPFWNGGRFAQTQREVKSSFKATVSIACVSSALSLAAAACSDGVVRVFDLSTMRVVALYMTPLEQDNIVVPCHAMCFVDSGVSVLVGVDGNARITLWAVAPATPACLMCFRITPFDFEASLNVVSSASWIENNSNKCFIYVGDELGFLWVIDVSGALTKQKQQQSSRRSYSAAVSSKRMNVIESLRLDKMTKEPIGMHSLITVLGMQGNAPMTRGSFYRSMSKMLGGRVNILKHFHPFISSVRCISVIRQESSLASSTSIDSKPSYILATSDRGVVKLFSIEGNELGEMHFAQTILNDTTIDLTDNKAWVFSEILSATTATEIRTSLMEKWLHNRRIQDKTENASNNYPGEVSSPINYPKSPNSLGKKFTFTSHTKPLQHRVNKDQSILEETEYDTWKSALCANDPTETTMLPLSSNKDLFRYMKHRRHEAEVRIRNKLQVENIWNCKARFPHLENETHKGMFPIVKDEAPSPIVRDNKLKELLSPGLGLEDCQLFAESSQEANETYTFASPLPSRRGSNELTRLPPVTGEGAGIDEILHALDDLTSPISRQHSHQLSRSPSGILRIGSSGGRIERPQTALPRYHSSSELVTQFETILLKDESPKSPVKRLHRSASKGFMGKNPVEQRGIVIDVEEKEKQIKKVQMLEKKQVLVSASRRRFGPYDVSDIISFVHFLIELKPGDKGWYIEESSLFSSASLMLTKDIAENQRASKMLESFVSKSDKNVMTKVELIQLIFEHATKAERGRINTITCLCQAVWRFFDTLLPPNDITQPVSVLPQLNKKEFTEKKISIYPEFSLKAFDTSHINKVSGLEGWMTSRDRLVEICSIFELFMKSNDGTCLFGELLVIIQSYSTVEIRQFRRPLEELLVKLNIERDHEVDGVLFFQVVSLGLHLQLAR